MICREPDRQLNARRHMAYAIVVAVSLMVTPFVIAQTANDKAAESSVSTHAKAFGEAVKRDSKAVGDTVKEGAHRVATAAKAVAHEIATAAKRGAAATRAAFRGEKTRTQGA